MAKADLKVSKPESGWEAFTYIFVGVGYFVFEKTKSTIAVALVLAGIILLGLNSLELGSYVKVQVEEAIGKKVEGSVHPSLFMFSQEKQKSNRIIVDGYDYGAYDENYVLYVLKGEWKLFVFDYRSGSARKIPAPWLENLDNFKKK